MPLISDDIDLSKKKQVHSNRKVKVKKVKTDRKVLIKRLDDVCSFVIRKIDREPWDKMNGPICNNHLITRANYKTRWHPLNCFAGTTGANNYHEYHPEIMNIWFMNKYSPGLFNALSNFSRGEAKYTNDQLKSILEWWETEIKINGKDRHNAILGYFRMIDFHDQQEVIKEYNKSIRRE